MSIEYGGDGEIRILFLNFLVPTITVFKGLYNDNRVLIMNIRYSKRSNSDPALFHYIK